MSSEHIDEKSVFNTARTIADAAARDNYVELACSDNPEALRRIRDLLRMHQEEQRFLESPPSGIDITRGMPPVTEQSGDTIGPYKLLQQIGEGGMGVVYMAELQQPFSLGGFRVNLAWDPRPQNLVLHFEVFDILCQLIAGCGGDQSE